MVHNIVTYCLLLVPSSFSLTEEYLYTSGDAVTSGDYRQDRIASADLPDFGALKM